MTKPPAEPFPIPDSKGPLDKQAVLSLLTAADRIRRHYTEILQAHGLTLQQYNALRILRGAGPRGLPILEIGERMIEQTPGVSRLVGRLVRQGLVSRRRCDEDARRVLCTLTPRAKDILAELDEPIARGDAECVGALTAREQQTLLELASRVLPAT